MSDNFTNDAISAALRDKILNSRNAQEIKDACVEDGIARGVFTRDASGSPSVREDVVAPQPAPQVSASASNGTKQFYEVVYPHENDRFEISADSAEELAQRKKQILAMYQR